MALSATFAVGYFLGNRAAPASDTVGAMGEHSIKKTVTNRRGDTASGTNQLGSHTKYAAAGNAVPEEVSAPLPPPGTALKEMFSDLRERAVSGDAQAATRLYQDVQRCRHVSEIMTRLSGAHSYGSGITLQYRSNELDLDEKDLHFAQDSESLCSGVTDEQLGEDSMVSNTLLAAQLGNLDAAECYVILNGLIPKRPQWLADYEQNAVALVNSAIDRGDWSMMQIVLNAYMSANSERADLLSHYLPASSAQVYRYYKLWSLGNYGESLGAYGDGSRGMDAASSQMTAAEVAAADEWATQMYRQHFNASPARSYAYAGRGVCSADYAP